MYRLIFSVFLMFLLVACPEPMEKPVQVTVPVQASQADYSYQLFDNTDSAGVMHGVGYDIYDGSKRIIHQVNIPGEPGNDGFVNREEAAKVAELVITKLESASGFPTIMREELDSLGITLQSQK